MAKVQTTSIAAGEPLADAPAKTAAPATGLPEVKPAAPLAVPIAAALTAAAVNTPAPAPEPAAPLRPGLENAAAPAPSEPNPFIQLNRWQVGQTHGTLRAMEVPGGCIVKSAFAYPGYMGESICFVPGVKVVEGKLV